MEVEETSAKYGPGASDEKFVKPSVALVRMIVDALEIEGSDSVLFAAIPLMNNAA